MSKKDASLAPVPPTAMTIALSPLAGLVLLVFLLSGLIACTWTFLRDEHIRWLPEQVTWQRVWDGEVTRHIAKQLSNVWLPRQAARLERAATWLTLGDTGERVRRGCEGWLFLNDENLIYPNATANAETRAAKVRDVQRWLAKQNIALLVVVVPDKSRIAAEQRCALVRPSEFNERVSQWQASLMDASVNVLDLALVLQPLGGGAFLRSDTHWSEQGAQAAAMSVAGQVAEMAITPTPSQRWERRDEAPQIRSGDLIRLAGLDWLPVSLQPVPDVLVPSAFVALEAPAATLEDDLFGDTQLPNVALIGTSFSRHSNFVGYLEQALEARIGNFARDGGAFAGAAADYFASAAFKQTPPHLIIWEIPERDLQAPYTDELLLPTL